MKGLLEAIEEWRCRRLVIGTIPPGVVDASDRISGLWMTSDKVDLIWVDPTAEGTQRDQIIGHEIGHMINGDTPGSLHMRVMSHLIGESDFTSLSPELVRKTLRPVVQSTLHRDGGYNEALERQAEQFATWVNGYLAERRRASSGDLMVSRMRDSLETRVEYW